MNYIEIYKLFEDIDYKTVFPLENIGQSSSKLQKAKKEKNDEFYTRIEDVEAELKHWKKRLFGKRIICPCDGPESAFVRFLNSVKEDWGIKSIDYSYYDIQTGDGISFLQIDYSQYDICITNPPFSLYKYFYPLIIGKIDFILISPFTNRWQKQQSEAYSNRKLFLGFGRHLPLGFTNTDKTVACDWITSFDDFNISRRDYDCEDWTETTLTAIDYISTYDYDIYPCKFGKEDYKKNNFHFWIKKIR